MCKDKAKIKVRVHEAYFVGNKTPHLFVNIANVAKHRQITITHLYFDHKEGVMDIIPKSSTVGVDAGYHAFPLTLEASECVEIPIPSSLLPESVLDNPFANFKVRDSNGQWYQSKMQHTLARENVTLLELK
jgi:hypothetical protein